MKIYIKKEAQITVSTVQSVASKVQTLKIYSLAKTM